jgi:hypothetical protein
LLESNWIHEFVKLQDRISVLGLLSSSVEVFVANTKRLGRYRTWLVAGVWWDNGDVSVKQPVSQSNLFALKGITYVIDERPPPLAVS